LKFLFQEREIRFSFYVKLQLCPGRQSPARTALEDWMESIVAKASNIGPVGYEYMVDKATVTQLGRDDAVIATYEFYNMWPTVIALVSLDAEATDTLETTDVTFAFSHFERVGE